MQAVNSPQNLLCDLVGICIDVSEDYKNSNLPTSVKIDLENLEIDDVIDLLVGRVIDICCNEFFPLFRLDAEELVRYEYRVETALRALIQ